MDHIVDALLDTLRTLPLLLGVLVLVEALEHRLSGRLERGLSLIGPLGPAIGAGVGVLPQCGGAVVASELYATRAVTLGTLLAVYLATSDEALPVLIANPGGLAAVGPLLLTKLAIGLAVGYTVDLVALARPPVHHARPLASDSAVSGSGGEVERLHHQHALGRTAYETRACLEGRLSLTALIWHSLRRCLRIAFFLAVTTSLLSWATEAVTATSATAAALSNTGVQVMASAAFGLVPSCAPSVAITELFAKGVLSYPALIAGLCANAGAGLMVLLHERGWRTVIRVASLLLISSVVAGFVVSLF